VKPGKINIHQAKTHLSRLIEDVASGNEVLIAKGGRPMARLVPLLKGRLRIADEFDRSLESATPL
jgi:prevent-host-death family protein